MLGEWLLMMLPPLTPGPTPVVPPLVFLSERRGTCGERGGEGETPTDSDCSLRARMAGELRVCNCDNEPRLPTPLPVLLRGEKEDGDDAKGAVATKR